MKKIFSVMILFLMFSVCITACGSDAEKIEWKNIALGEIVPQPQSDKMEVSINDHEWLSVDVHKISENDYYEYVRWCEDEKGFTIDTQNYGLSFCGYNQDGYYISLYYDDNGKVMSISLDAPIPMEEYQIPEYAIQAGMPLPDSKKGHFNWEETNSFFLYVGDTTIDEYETYEKACLDAGFNVDVYEGEGFYSAENENGYKLSIDYRGYNIFSIEFYCPDDVDVTEDIESQSEEDNVEVDVSQITVSMSEEDFLGMNYLEAEKLLKEMGFSVFEYQILNTDDQEKTDGTIGAVEIKTWAFGKGEFEKGDTYESDAIVVLWYYECEEVVPNLTAENCEDLATILELKDPSDALIEEFAYVYEGQIIEFDGCIHSMQNHGEYDTRFDILIGAGNYDADSMKGPNFRLTDVNGFDMDISTLYLEDELSVGKNIHVIAEVDEYDAYTTFFELDVIKVEVR